MKYAITSPKGRILEVLDESTDETKEITNKQAIIIKSSKDPIFLIDGELKTQAEVFAIRRLQYELQHEAARIAAMTPEQLAAKQQRDTIRQQREASQAAYDTAAAAFETLPLGIQALWEPVRAKVAQAILSGNIAIAIEILQTTPLIYDGAEVDRDTFLTLFT